MMSNDDENMLSLSYNFSSEEIKFLAKFFRKYQDKIPKPLESFSAAIEQSIYENMSIDEVETFFYEKN